MSSRWLRMPFSQAVEVNPRRIVARGTLAPFVDMAALPTEIREVRPRRVRPVGGGGSRFTNGDTLFARITPCTENGKTGLVDCLPTGEVATGSTEFIVLCPRHELTLPRFVYYMAKSPIFRSFAVSRMRGTSGRQRVPASVFDDFKVGVPPLPEQRKIAAILSSVDDAIEKTQAVIDQVQVVKRGLMQELLTRGLPGRHTRFKQTEIGEIPEEWDLRPAATVCERIVVGIVIKPAQYYTASGVPCLRSLNVTADQINYRSMKYISHESNHQLRKSQLSVGDVVTVRTGYPGTSAVIPAQLDGANCVDLIITTPGPSLRGTFLSRFINSDRGRAAVAERRVGLAQQHFNVGAMKAMLTPIPSLEEQDDICNVVQSSDQNLQAETALLHGLFSLKAALMSVLLSGELRVTPDTETA